MIDMSASFPDRVGGRLCLDFVNTVDPRHAADRVEHLSGYQAVLDWCEWAEVDLPRSIRWLRAEARRDPVAARTAYRRVVATREALYAVLHAAVSGEPAAAADLALVNDALGDGIGHRLLEPASAGVREAWRPADTLDQVLWPVALDAWDLLTEPELSRVRECPGDDVCGWLFLDTSRSGTRRWCDMRTCGNRAKARAHYSRAAR